jgi:hypothetical protein
MSPPDRAYLQGLATECVQLVFRQYHQRLDWSPESLSVLDEVCAELLADGPLDAGRLDLWWRLVGAYTGEVMIRTYAGEWTSHDNSPAVSALGVIAFPFGLAARVLRGEPYKSLASHLRALPTVAEQGRHTDDR